MYYSFVFTFHVPFNLHKNYSDRITEYFPFNPICYHKTFPHTKNQQILFQLSGIFNEKKTLKINNNNNI